MHKKFIKVALAALSVLVVTGTVGSSALAEEKESQESSVLEVTDETADKEIFEEKKPVFIDFFATWCPPCKRLSPIIDELSGAYKDTVKFVKVDVDKSPMLRDKYEIMAMPTMKLLTQKCKKGKSLVGYHEKDQIKSFVDKSVKECK